MNCLVCVHIEQHNKGLHVVPSEKNRQHLTIYLLPEQYTSVAAEANSITSTANFQESNYLHYINLFTGQERAG